MIYISFKKLLKEKLIGTSWNSFIVMESDVLSGYITFNSLRVVLKYPRSIKMFRTQ